MTTKPKTRKTPAAKIDPVFAAIAEHKTMTLESDRLEKSYRTARAKAEKKHGEWIGYIQRCRSGNRSKDKWPGEAIISPFYDRWSRAGRAERKAAIRMARTKPATISGAAAMIAHIRRETAGASEIEDWVITALTTASAALTRLDGA
jgi:hypothetical protein